MLTLPRLRRVALRDFSLFTRVPSISLELKDGVSCLAGANGIGKSTFIAALNFALTGRVPERTRRFQSVEEYHQHTEPFSRRFFEGRIAEIDRESAEVEVEFEVGEFVYRLVRGMFEPNELRVLEIVGRSGSGGGPDLGSLTQSELQQEFASHVTKQMGLESFPQFVFLQLFLLTFDERRHLAFWDPEVLEQILFLAFGFDPEVAQIGERLRRRMEKQDSIARNKNWQATEARKKLRDLEDFMARRPERDEDLVEEHRELVQVRDSLGREVEQIERELRDGKLRLADLSSSYATLQQEYEETFATRASRQRGPRFHPTVVASVADGCCALCGAQGEEVVRKLEERANSQECPLCGTVVDWGAEHADSMLEDLKEIDRRLQSAKAEVRGEAQKIRRLESEEMAAQSELGEVEAAIKRLEAENEGTLRDASRGDGQELEEVCDSYRRLIKELLEAKAKARKQRDEARSQLGEVHRRVTRQYQAVEKDFVPLFKRLGQAFLGLDLDVRFEERRGEIGLALDVEGQPRREHHQLSESQRFFVDIALRMALAQFMCGDHASATMLIDTPEGSLDSAYESRAGEMFAQFVEAGNDIVMTANINTSELLLRLASRCGASMMQLYRMTDWTELSEVQVAEEGLFDKAYSAIHEALERGHPNGG